MFDGLLVFTVCCHVSLTRVKKWGSFMKRTKLLTLVLISAFLSVAANFDDEGATLGEIICKRETNSNKYALNVNYNIERPEYKRFTRFTKKDLLTDEIIEDEIIPIKLSELFQYNDNNHAFLTLHGLSTKLNNFKLYITGISDTAFRPGVDYQSRIEADNFEMTLTCRFSININEMEEFHKIPLE